MSADAPVATPSSVMDLRTKLRRKPGNGEDQEKLRLLHSAILPNRRA